MVVGLSLVYDFSLWTYGFRFFFGMELLAFVINRLYSTLLCWSSCKEAKQNIISCRIKVKIYWLLNKCQKLFREDNRRISESRHFLITHHDCFACSFPFKTVLIFFVGNSFLTVLNNTSTNLISWLLRLNTLTKSWHEKENFPYPNLTDKNFPHKSVLWLHV